MRYTPQQKQKKVDEICTIIAQDKIALRNILNRKDMPDSNTFYNWINNDPEMLSQYARACSDRADGIFEEMLQIADTEKVGVTVRSGPNGTETIEGDMIQHRRLQVDTRKWVLAKMNPKKYGDSSLLKLGNPDGEELKINAIFSKDLLNVPTNDRLAENSET
jgi:hypothetical protein